MGTFHLDFFRGKNKKTISLLLSAVLALMVFLPYLPPLQLEAAENDNLVTLTTAHGDFGGDHRLYCIDKGGLAIWGIADDGDQYQKHSVSSMRIPLSEKEQEYIFWGILTLQASLGIPEAASAVKNINAEALKQGKEGISNLITEEDLKALIYRSDVRAKYPWLDTAAANTEDYLKMAGLIGGGSGTTQSGKKIPDVIAGSTSESSAYQISRSDFTIHFDESGADADFIASVPIQFSSDSGATFTDVPPDGWTYSKTDTGITFYNPNPRPPKVLIKFAVSGTDYAATGGGYASERELFEHCLQLWECVRCSGTHTGGTPAVSPTEIHQRMVWLDLDMPQTEFYAVLGSDPFSAQGGADLTFNVFRHAEDFTSTYNVQMYKYDHETGKPLEGARFVLYERFDDLGKIDREKDGPVHIYEGGEPYASFHMDDPVIWDGFRQIGTIVTGEDGHAAKTVTHGYHYDKTFCDGHPAPSFAAVPEPEEDEESGETLNSEAIAAAKAANQAAAKKWLDTVADCEEKAGGDFEGVHFHWLTEEVSREEIENIAGSGGEEGTTPDGGSSEEPSADTAYEKSGCYQDMLDTYEKFISLKYSYALTEFQAKDSYIRHDIHSDDLPIEIITTDASENGANASFSGEYSDHEALESESARGSAALPEKAVKGQQKGQSENTDGKETAGETEERPVLFQKIKEISQEILSHFFSEEDEREETEEMEEEEETEEQTSEKEKSESEAEEQTPEKEKSESEAEEQLPEKAEEETAEQENGYSEQEKEEDSAEPETEEEKSEEPEKETEENSKAEISSRPSLLVQAGFRLATPSGADSTDHPESEDGDKKEIRQKKRTYPATTSNAVFRWSRHNSAFRSPLAREEEKTGREGVSLFPSAYEGALTSDSIGSQAEPGPDDNYSHCSDKDGEGNAWRIYDHRTEAEFHINKKDLDLAAGESEDFDAYGETQGDTTLEGAIYGLFAAEDIVHPDGKTGTVYRANNLVAVAATDRNGDASFLVNTEAPGRTYDYETGRIAETSDGWANEAPENLYVADISCDDYREDGVYERVYQDNETKNGNCWIGRPLLLGDYYIKELSRSEGYELSVGNKSHNLTNRGQDLRAEAPEGGKGWAVISEPMYAEEQTSGDGEGAGPNELYFSARSRDTENQRYDLLLSNLPEGVQIYRKEIGTKQVEVTVGTGDYEKILLTNPDGTPRYLTAEHDYQYLKYNEDGSLMTREVPMNVEAHDIRQVSVRRLEEGAADEAIRQAEEGMTEEEIQAELAKPFKTAALPFVKGKVEKALRRNGKSTPRSRLKGGRYGYSSIREGVFDRGVREGETDSFGLSGVEPGNPAAYTVYGSPVQTLLIEKMKEDGTALTVGDAILSVLDYYDSHPYYSYGGIDAVEEEREHYRFTVYASVDGNPDHFMVLGSDAVTDSIICRAVDYLPADTSRPPRRIYAVYSNNPDYGAFGTYEDYSEQAAGSSVLASATLVTDAVADAEGNLRSRTRQENVYYKTGELVRDPNGNLIQACEYREIMKTEIQEAEEVKWQKIPSERREDGTYLIPVEAAYTDAFGVSHTNDGMDQTISFKAVLKETQVVLSEEDAKKLNHELMGGFSAGSPMGSASYYVHAKKARAKAYLDCRNQKLTGEDAYTIPVSLTYPGQKQIYADGGTRSLPAQVYERPIRQRIKVVKDIHTNRDGSYGNNTYDYPETAIEKNFRFKAYLKSNLERLYRAEDGTVVWMDRNGNEISYEELLDFAYPETLLQESENRRRENGKNGQNPIKINVPKLFTKALHDTASTLTSISGNNILSSYQDPETADQNAARRIPFDTSIAPGGIGVLVNASLYSYRGQNINTGKTPQIRREANKGYTRLLETEERQEKSGKEPVTIQVYNYDKFFDAVRVANTDKWDEKHQTYTSWKPLGNAVKRTEYAENNARASDMVRQFAITWYLDDEAAKLLKDNGEEEDEAKKEEAENLSSEMLYDEALNAALSKAYDYLKPFFLYDLDELYAVCWDGEEGGGEDKDPTTVCADREAEGNGAEYCYGLSAYLPYGTYVIAEQQPTKELANKHYQMDGPKEIQVPSVYEPGTSHEPAAELSHAYRYDADQSLDAQAAEENYLIRFGEEWDKNASDQREYVIHAHSHDGDFEVYKYGLEPDKLTGAISYGGESYEYKGFSITQEEYDPLKDYYHPVHKAGGRNLTKEEGANENSHYFADDGNKGQTAENGKPYEDDAIEARYSYGSISEQAGKAGSIRFEHEAGSTEENGAGAVYRSARAMQGVQTAYDGLYAPMLVPYSVLEPEQEGAYDPVSFKGYADGKFRNTFYSARLRIDKLDSETHENLLHDGALFMIYKASRDKKTGEVKFYEEDTVLTGSEEFLKAMGASGIQPLHRKKTDKPSSDSEEAGPGTLHSGTVKAGTPVCKEQDQIVLSDSQGNLVGQFKAFSTVSDVSMKQEDTNQAPDEYRLQTVGYLTTPQPLGAGTYVLAEVPPRGYVRTAPVAIEIYSDKVTYYKEGKQDRRVRAAIYEERMEGGSGNGNTPRNPADIAHIYVENIPIKLQVEKLKPRGTVTFRIGERIEGGLTEIGGNRALQYAYDDNGTYLGYAYPKGTLERLAALREAGEQVEIVYDGSHFAGYGYVTKRRETDDDENPYVAGARLTLFDAIELIPSGDSEDLAFEGLSVERNLSNSVINMTVKQGFAGEKTELVREEDENGEPILTDYVTGLDEEGNPVAEKGYVWKEGTVERPDTEILYYPLDGLSLTWTEQLHGRRVLYGWDKNHQKVSVSQLQADQTSQGKADKELSLYAFKGGQPYLELVGGDLTKLSYDAVSKILKGDFASLQFVTANREWKMGEGTAVYHLDRDGNRDARVDPYTGMAYVLEPKFSDEGVHVADRVLVWPVETARDADGAVTARDKIATSRIATVGENQDGYGEEEVLEPNNQTDQKLSDSEKPSYSHQEFGYISGTWQSEKGEESHREETVRQNQFGQNMNQEVLADINNGTFLNYMSPVYDEHGLVLYYQRSNETYDKGSELYDRNGDFVRYKNSDNLEEYNDGAYALDDHEVLYDGDAGKEHQTQDRLYHRRGENYILENTWLTSDKTPNDPFSTEELAGQADVIKHLPAGTYILEEISAPEGEGYTKSFPQGVTVEEDARIKNIQVYDDTTKGYFEKIDGVESGRETAANYTNRQLPGAGLALYPARYVADPASPEGYRLEKTSDTPYRLETTNSRAGAEEYQEMAWTTEETPFYVEGLPAGWYILEELTAPPGFLKAAPMNIQVDSTGEIQNFRLYNDHTKVAFRKYTKQEGEKPILPGAEFTLYEAKTDEEGQVIYDENGLPRYKEERPVESWISDDAADYTESIDLRNYPNLGDMKGKTGFTLDFEAMYEEYGIHGTGFTWYAERTAVRDSRDSKVWRLQDGSRVLIGTDGETGEETVTFPPQMKKEDREGFKAAYAAMLGKKRTLKWAVPRTAAVTDAAVWDASLAGGASAEYPDVAKVTLTVQETGKTVLADVRYNGSGFEYSYKFDYHQLPQINSYTNAWLTGDGSRRIDYLPAGAAYVLVETKAPEGFAAMDPLLVTVGEEKELQLHEILNERKALALSKASSATGKELPGAELALYWADEAGELSQTEEYLVASWITGTDGVYTETDRINGRILEGFEEGDLKPHFLYDLPDGTYYLSEIKAPDYYRMAEPLKFEYTGTQNEAVQIERMIDEPFTGELLIHKTDEKGGSLSGVVFELSACEKNGTLVAGFPKKISDINGTVHVEGLPTGRINPEDGSVEPYIYRLKELVPPEGFAVNPQIHSFQFDETEGEPAETIIYEMEVENEATRIYLEKKELSDLGDAGTDGAFVEGARMAVYRVSELDEEGGYTWAEEDLAEEWTTAKTEGRHLLEGLTAGRAYVLVEREAPEGYTLMRPVFFTVKRDGRGIDSISNNLSAISVHYREENGDPSCADSNSIDSITFKGRTIVKAETAILNEKGEELLRFVETGEEHVFHREDGLRENGLYTFEEHTIYSDGSDVITKRSTRRVHFDKDGVFRYAGRAAAGLALLLTDSEGAAITEFQPEEGALETTVTNRVNPENPKAVIRSRTGQEGEPLERGQAVISTIHWYNPKHTPQDLTIRVTVKEGMEVIDPCDGTLERDREAEKEETVVWTVSQAAPLSQGSVSFASELTKEAEAAALSVTVENSNKESFSSEKRVPVRQENRLTVYSELTGSGKEQHKGETSRFTIRLWNRNGDELAGTYAYTGSCDGTMRSGDTIELSENEFITIDPVLTGCTYEVSREENGMESEAHQLKGRISEEGAAAWFTREVEDPTERAVFVRGNTYYLTETTFFSDNTEEISGRLSFTIDAHAGISIIGGYDKETKTIVEKADLLTGEPVVGARLQLYELPELPDGEETLTVEWTTGEETFSVSGLKPGRSYRLKEAAAPDGYGYASDITFTVNEDGAAEEIRMEDRPTHLIVSKQDITNGEELPGAHLQLLDSEGKVTDEWVSGETPHEIRGKLRADETYTLRETIPADGFVIADDIAFTVNHDGSINYVEMKDDTTKVRIYKNRYVETEEDKRPGTPSNAFMETPSDTVHAEEAGAVAVKGAVLQILNEDKTPALYQGKEMIFTTGETFTLLEKQLTAGNTYWLHEIKPAPGYGFSEDVKFTVSTDGRTDVVVMEDRQTKAVLSKKAITGEEELSGCKMQLVDEKGIIIDQWLSRETPHEITGILEAGHTYRLIEIKPAPGYAYAEEAVFTVNRDGTVNQVEMRDDVTKVEILKLDAGTGKPLAGARFEILDQNGKVREAWTSTGEPHRIYGKLTAGEHYILREISAPAGYRSMEDTEFTVNDYADVLTIVVENMKKGGGGETDYTVRLKKVDEDGKPLPGAGFTVKDQNGRLLTLEEEQGGTVFKLTLKTPQTITVEEAHAPDGYEKLDGSYQIRIPRSGDAEILNGDLAFYQDTENSYVFFVVNKKAPEVPETTKQPELKGKITAEYDESLYGEGSIKKQKDRLEIPFTKTGDTFPVELAAGIFVVSAAGLLGLWMAGRRKKKKGGGKK